MVAGTRLVDAPTIYFIPGTQCDEQLWQWLWPQFPDLNCRHLAIPVGDSVADVVDGLVAQLPANPVAVFGFSLGGYLAAALALAAPDRIERLFVCANSACALPTQEILERQQLIQAIDRFGYRGLHDNKIAQMVAPENLSSSAIADCMKAMDQRLGVDNLIQQLRVTSERLDLQTALASLEIPITYCYGEQDNLVSESWVAALAKRNQWVRQCVIPDSGHMLPLEQPEKLARAIKSWLAR